MRLSVVAVAVTTALLMMMVATAAAENPVYCEGKYPFDEGCSKGPNGPLRANEARELESGCVSVQDVVEGEFGPVKEMCGGTAGGWELESGHGGTTYPRCWDRTSPEGRIRCRYSEW
jgi:hypothetical protein